MGKHSKQASTRGFFTSGEREKLKGKYGTATARLGVDSQRKFDQCNLCLNTLVDPVATPSGNLFCRECILKNLLAQKEALDLQRRAYDAYKAEKAADVTAKKTAETEATIRTFERLEGGVTASTAFSIASQSTSTLDLQRKQVETAAAAMLARSDPRTKEERQSEVEKASFWIPESTPETDTKEIPPPDPAPRDPVSGEFLRAKQLLTLHLTLAKPPATDDDDAGVGVADDGSGETGRFMCPACMKTIVFQKTYLFKNCGHVLCDKCVARFVAPSKKCFVCDGTVLKADVVKLQQGGSSFAGHDGTQAEAKKYTPTLIT